MKHKIRIGIVGVGFISQTCHINSFFEQKSCEIIAVADKRKDIAKKVANYYGIKNIFFSHKELISSNLHMDGVVIITKRSMNGPIAYDFLQNGYNIFSEKPMCLSFSQAQKLLKIQKKKKLIFSVGYNKRFDYGIQKAKKTLLQIIKKKQLGKIIYVKSHRFSGTGYQGSKEKFKSLQKYPDSVEWPNAPNWIKSKDEKYSFHGYLNTFSHNINLLRYFFDEQPKVDYVKMKNDSVNIVILKYKKFNCSIETKNYKDDAWDENIIIYFQYGYLKIDIPPQMKKNSCASFTIFNRKTLKKKSYKFKSKWSFYYQSKEFINNLKFKKNGISSSFDHIKDILLIEDIWKKWLKR